MARWFWAALALALLVGCEREPMPPFDQQLYVWQRQWRAAHGEALAQSKADFSSLRVLALQAHPQAGWAKARIDMAQLRADGRPLVAVVRLDGQLAQLDVAEIRQRIHGLLAEWSAAGLNLRGLEIDHDCASARLPAYRELLAALRSDLPAPLALSITALPAWLDSPALEALLAEVNGSVLQVHAVSSPERGLFDAQRAERWARRYAERSPQPFYLALPAYGSALIVGGEGPPLVESEAPLPVAGQRRELTADPRALAGLIQRLGERRPERLAGLIWFRLPLPGDRRAWPLATLRAVARGTVLTADVRLELHRQGDLHELRLHNQGTLDGRLPMRIELSGENCEAGDGLGEYRLQRPLQPIVFARRLPGQLPAGGSLALGWLRCSALNTDHGGWHAPL
jgi:hypothetical protein